MSGNDKFNAPRGFSGPSDTRRLVALELLPALEMLPSFDFNAEVLRALRAGAPVHSICSSRKTSNMHAASCAQAWRPSST